MMPSEKIKNPPAPISTEAYSRLRIESIKERSHQTALAEHCRKPIKKTPADSAGSPKPRHNHNRRNHKKRQSPNALFCLQRKIIVPALFALCRTGLLVFCLAFFFRHNIKNI